MRLKFGGNKAKTSSSTAQAESSREEETIEKEGSSSSTLVGGIAAFVLVAGAGLGVYSIMNSD